MRCYRQAAAASFGQLPQVVLLPFLSFFAPDEEAFPHNGNDWLDFPGAFADDFLWNG